MLSAQPLKEAAIDPSNCRATHFKWAWCNALVDKATFYNNFAVSENGIASVVGHAKSSGVEHHVAAALFVNEIGACHGFFNIDERWEHVVIDDDEFCSIFTLFACFSNNSSNGFTYITNLFAREQCALCHGVESGRHFGEVEAVTSEDSNDARRIQCIGSIDAGNDSVCNRATHISNVRSAREKRFVL